MQSRAANCGKHFTLFKRKGIKRKHTMNSMKIAGRLLVVAALTSVPTWGATPNQAENQVQSAHASQTAAPAQPGALNYVEGRPQLGANRLPQNP